MNRGQVLSGLLGLATIASVFLLPFSNIAEGPNGTVDTLYAIFDLFVTTLPNILSIGLAAISNLAYVYIVATCLLFASGILGIRAWLSGLLGIVGMAMATISPFFIFTSYTFSSTDFGVGFFALWAFPIVSIVAGFWARRVMRINKSPAPAPAATSQLGP